MKLWMGNLDPAATDDDLQKFVTKYGGPEFATIEHVPGDGSRPGVMITFKDADPVVLDRMVQRLNGMYWRGRSLVVQVLHM